ncbi:MAG TPA: hypothetical protein PLG33_06660 [Prolixibacteraceae bacterium]|nr:hypothetical protein [Prolixibacteraceae bacterium]
MTPAGKTLRISDTKTFHRKIRVKTHDAMVPERGLEATHKLARPQFWVGEPMYKVHGSTFGLANQCTKFTPPPFASGPMYKVYDSTFGFGNQCTKFMTLL